MKKISSRFLGICLLLILCIIAAAVFYIKPNKKKKTGGNVLITGKLSNSKGDTLFLVDVSKSEFKVLDSVITGDDGSFDFHPTLLYKGFYNIDVGKSSQQFAVLIVEPGDSLTFTGDAKNLGYTWKVEGGKDAKRFEDLNDYITNLEKRRQPYKETLDSLQRTFQVEVSMLPQGDSLKVDSLDKIFGAIYEATQAKLNVVEQDAAQHIREFIDQDSSSFANIPALRLLEPFDNFDYYTKVVRELEKNYKDAPNVKMLADYVERTRHSCKGQIPPDINLSDPNGKKIKLSSLKGSIVLIDFWASWCAPCRAELPNVVNNYKKHHAEGFEVYSVSLDKDKAAWTGAIKSEGLIWPYHVSDLKEWQSSVVPLYDIKGIPKTILLDRSGRIIDRDLRGDALTQKLDEIFALEKPSNK
jgi:thiol-disulfide isomerase/thioredoxin